MVQLNLEVRASTPQESPDIVVSAGHWEQQHASLGRKLRGYTLGGYARRIQGLAVQPFRKIDSPEPAAPCKIAPFFRWAVLPQ